MPSDPVRPALRVQQVVPVAVPRGLRQSNNRLLRPLRRRYREKARGRPRVQNTPEPVVARP